MSTTVKYKLGSIAAAARIKLFIKVNKSPDEEYQFRTDN